MVSSAFLFCVSPLFLLFAWFARKLVPVRILCGKVSLGDDRRAPVSWRPSLGAACAGMLLVGPSGAPECRAAAEAADFVRFVGGETRDQLQVAVGSYLNKDGIAVDLVGAVHIADPGYYRELNERFTEYDAVLFELVGDPEALTLIEEREASPNVVRMLQMMMTDVLKLQFQLTGIDYSPAHFVHADLTLDEFLREQNERGESVFTFLLKTMKVQMAREQAGAQPVGMWQLVRAFYALDRASALKSLLAEQLAEAESLIGAAEDETVLLTGRNKRALEVLEGQVAKGSKRLAIFFGAAHCPDLEHRLGAMGYRRIGKRWLTAWHIPKPEEVGLGRQSTEEPEG